MHLISGVFDPNNILIHVSQNFVNFAVSRMIRFWKNPVDNDNDNIFKDILLGKAAFHGG